MFGSYWGDKARGEMKMKQEKKDLEAHGYDVLVAVEVLMNSYHFCLPASILVWALWFCFGGTTASYRIYVWQQSIRVPAFSCPRPGQSNIPFIDFNPGRDEKKQLDTIVPRATLSRDSSLGPVTRILRVALVPVCSEVQVSHSSSVMWINPYPSRFLFCFVLFCLSEPELASASCNQILSLTLECICVRARVGRRHWTGLGRLGA